MTARDFYFRIVLYAIAATLVVAAIFFIFGAQAYRLYAWPVAMLLILPFLSSTMAIRMRACGLRPRRRFWLVIPLFLVAVIRIAYWVAFFSSQQLAAMMHVIKSQVDYLAGPLILVPYALIALLSLWYLYRLGRDRKPLARR